MNLEQDQESALVHELLSALSSGEVDEVVRSALLDGVGPRHAVAPQLIQALRRLVMQLVIPALDRGSGRQTAGAARPPEHNSRLGQELGEIVESDLEGLSTAERDHEIARRLVRFGRTAGKMARQFRTSNSPGRSAASAVQTALKILRAQLRRRRSRRPGRFPGWSGASLTQVQTPAPMADSATPADADPFASTQDAAGASQPQSGAAPGGCDCSLCKQDSGDVGADAAATDDGADGGAPPAAQEEFNWSRQGTPHRAGQGRWVRSGRNIVILGVP
jgi:hypothetical protein